MGLFDGTPLERPVTCAACGQASDRCACPRDARGNVVLPADQPARVRREKRRGKWVTVVTGLDPVASDLPGLVKRLKRRCSAGGAVRDDGLEVQGDHCQAVMAELTALGYPAKRAGG